MRGFLIWLLSALAAFFITAGAFLFLANLGSNVSETELAPRSPSDPQPLIELDLNRNQLTSLQPLEEQRLSVEVINGSERTFSQVSITVRVTSDNTAFGESRYYRAEIRDLEAGDSKSVRSFVDLSPFEAPQGQPARSDAEDRDRIILQVQATTPEGISSFKTAVLSF